MHMRMHMRMHIYFAAQPLLVFTSAMACLNFLWNTFFSYLLLLAGLNDALIVCVIMTTELNTARSNNWLLFYTSPTL